jgi:hypothetical protein
MLRRLLAPFAATREFRRVHQSKKKKKKTKNNNKFINKQMSFGALIVKQMSKVFTGNNAAKEKLIVSSA